MTDKIRYRRKHTSKAMSGAATSAAAKLMVGWRDGEINFVWEYDGVDIIDLVGGGSLIPAFGDEWIKP